MQRRGAPGAQAGLSSHDTWHIAFRQSFLYRGWHRGRPAGVDAVPCRANISEESRSAWLCRECADAGVSPRGFLDAVAAEHGPSYVVVPVHT